MMPDVEEHLSVHRVTESALGVGLGGECGAGEYSPPSPFLAGSALFFWCVCVCVAFLLLKTYLFKKSVSCQYSPRSSQCSRNERPMDKFRRGVDEGGR